MIIDDECQGEYDLYDHDVTGHQNITWALFFIGRKNSRFLR